MGTLNILWLVGIGLCLINVIIAKVLNKTLLKYLPITRGMIIFMVILSLIPLAGIAINIVFIIWAIYLYIESCHWDKPW